MMEQYKLSTRYKRRSHSIFKDILETCSKSEHPKILDVGCSFGVVGALKGDPKNVIGIECDKDALPLAEKNCEKVYSLDLNNFNKTQIKEGPFDIIFFGDILEHLLAPEAVLKEMLELLRDDGYAIVSLPNVAQLQFRLMLLLGNFNYTEKGVLDRSHLHFYTAKTALELISSAGLTPLKFYPSGTVVSFINILPRLLAAQFIYVCKKNRNQ